MSRAGVWVQGGQEGERGIPHQELEEVHSSERCRGAIKLGADEKGEVSSTGKNHGERLQGSLRGCSSGMTMKNCTESHSEVISISK